jgi:hypothetical protein
MTGARPTAAIVIFTVTALLVPVAFVAVSTTLVIPAAVGVPVMAPVDELRTRPAGSGLAVKLVGEPVAVMVYVVNTVPTVPGAVVALVMTGAMPAAAIVMVTVAGLLVPIAFVAVSETTVAAAAVGVPVMAPVDELRTRPAGSGLAVKLVGVPVAVMVYVVNTVPTVPGAVVALVMTGAMPAAAIVVVTVTGLLVPVGFVAVSTTLVTPAAVGVPVMAPVDELRTRPAGSGLAV